MLMALSISLATALMLQGFTLRLEFRAWQEALNSL
jgi:hypothetical protein